eukprot:CAMPEP_0202458814 /NCGR_PEP_ID=MMETSP1360-20130828/28478_1 /ASSEMBLY_ACC=CAM_ASM_000848 /TAXON_ID=515479 /ORGANISM="Licmophora paradoxa, Strain CCMP2313" /LENGTH=60 /DNA_ID=CAMNT_0049079545 /DNA_START=47 /DNA_END=229 /DNA_ORIENTATION=-
MVQGDSLLEQLNEREIPSTTMTGFHQPVGRVNYAIPSKDDEGNFVEFTLSNKHSPTPLAQ